VFRPITLNPYPTDQLRAAAAGRTCVICFELNEGQMIIDVKAAISGDVPVEPILGGGRDMDADFAFGSMPTVEQVQDAISRVATAYGRELEGSR
jgi:pyruvate/2-oxoacid:ferredoxin oxidoreductase alpha subunit